MYASWVCCQDTNQQCPNNNILSSYYMNGDQIYENTTGNILGANNYVMWPIGSSQLAKSDFVI
jgi:hypothetical protein